MAQYLDLPSAILLRHGFPFLNVPLHFLDSVVAVAFLPEAAEDAVVVVVVLGFPPAEAGVAAAALFLLLPFITSPKRLYRSRLFMIWAKFLPEDMIQ